MSLCLDQNVARMVLGAQTSRTNTAAWIPCVKMRVDGMGIWSHLDILAERTNKRRVLAVETI